MKTPIPLLPLVIVGAVGLGVGGTLWAAGVVGSGGRAAPVEAMAPEVLLLTERADPYAASVADQVEAALRRAKVPFAVHDLAAPLPALDGYRAVLTVVERFAALDDAEADRLGAFVEAGGGLGVLYRGWGAHLAPLLGTPSAPPAFVSEAEVFATEAALMPGEEGLRIGPMSLSSYAIAEVPGCETLAVREGADGRRLGPAAWVCRRGRGTVVYWNLAALGTKPFRGHVLQTLALVHPGHARPVAGWAVVFLDDFPSPASNARLEPIWSRTGQTPAQFYAETWYPDMVRLAEQAGLRYTSTVIYAYNGKTTGPFRFDEWLAGRAEVEGRTVPYSPWVSATDARRSEQALHGYNHQPLTLSRWGSRRPMVEALRAARRRWEVEGAAPLPTVYVPPMNTIDSAGVAALREAFPEIAVLASTYTGSFETGEGREFGPEPWAPSLYALPRNTAGYVMTPSERLKTLSVLHSVGAWNHFVHPDEVYANADREAVYRAEGLPSPSSLGWRDGDEGLLPAFERWVAFVREHYPWLDGVSASEAADRMRALDALEIAWDESRTEAGRRLDISASASGQTVYVWARPGERVASVDGARVLDTWEGPVLTQVVVRSARPRFSIAFEPTPDS